MQFHLGLDLNEWLRGERNWLDLWDLLGPLQSMQGTRYQAAKLRDPEVVDALAAMPEDAEPEIPLEGFTALHTRLANIEDRLTQLTYVTAHSEAAAAPLTPRPRMPHIERRAEIKRERDRAFEEQLIPGGD